MCVYSAIGPAFEPLVPHPIPVGPIPTVPITGPHAADCKCLVCIIQRSTPAPSQWPWGPVPSTGLPISPEDLKTLLDAFHKAVAAAKAADRAAGQPDCVDADKVKLEDRVAELERRLEAMSKALMGQP